MCGIIGVYNHENAAEMAALGLFALQHRGQESCGIAVSDGAIIKLRKQMGLVKQVFTPEVLQEFKGKIAIGHVRYPTRGSSTASNSQPHLGVTLAGPSFALASNGDIINYVEMCEQLRSKGVYFTSSNDGELLLKYIMYQVEKEGKTIVEAIKLLMRNIKGAYSTVLMTRHELYLFRDPHAIRPMVWAKLNDGSVAVASESCALDILDPKQIREVKPAEIIVINEKGVRHIEQDANEYRAVKNNRHCIFSLIYFSRPDSWEFDEHVYQVRERIGAQLAQKDEIEADFVVPVPDSANFIALGYAKERDIPYEFGLIRNHYVGRTFIKPDQTIRDESVKQKFNALPGFFSGKSIVLVDDSIVRGTTLRKIIGLLRKAGAREIHLRIGSPQVRFSCFYGIDTPDKKDLIANNMTDEEIREYLAVDSLQYLSVEQLHLCVKKPEDYCNACFTGKYAVEA